MSSDTAALMCASQGQPNAQCYAPSGRGDVDKSLGSIKLATFGGIAITYMHACYHHGMHWHAWHQPGSKHMHRHGTRSVGGGAGALLTIRSTCLNPVLVVLILRSRAVGVGLRALLTLRSAHPSLLLAYGVGIRKYSMMARARFVSAHMLNAKHPTRRQIFR